MALPPIGYQALRKGRVSEAGRLYFITKSTKERVQKEWSAEEKLAQSRLLQVGVPQIIMSSLDWLQQKQLISLTAYCLMPDHLHLLFQLGEIAQLENVVKRLVLLPGWRYIAKLDVVSCGLLATTTML